MKKKEIMRIKKKIMRKEGLLKKHRENILKIAKMHGAMTVRVFGSIIRGNEKEDSDIDLLVTMEPGSSLLDIIAIKQDLEDLLNSKVDVVTENSLSPYIRDEVLKEAINL